MTPMHLDPRTKLFLIVLCVLSAMFAPNLYVQFALAAGIGLLAACCGRWRYALRGILAYALICAFTVWSMGVLRGTWRTMFVAFLGLVHKVYTCGFLAGLVIGTTRVGEFLSAMARLRVPKKLTIPIAVMLRYLPMGYFNENSLGSITSVTTNTMDNLSGLATRVTMFVTEGIVSTAVLTLAEFLFDWRVGLLIVAGVVIYYFVNHALQKKSEQTTRRKLAGDTAVIEL